MSLKFFFYRFFFLNLLILNVVFSVQVYANPSKSVIENALSKELFERVRSVASGMVDHATKIDVQKITHIEWYKSGARISDSILLPRKNALGISFGIEQEGFLWQEKSQEVSQDFNSDFLSITQFHNPVIFAPKTSFANFIERGMHSFHISCKGRQSWVPASRFIVQNRKAEKMLSVHLKKVGCTKDDLKSGDAILTRYDSIHAVQQKAGAAVIPMYRSQPKIYTIEDVTHENLELMLNSLQSWLLRNQSRNGALAYKYWPSKNEFSNANNMIRQWMATDALGALMEQRSGYDKEVLEIAIIRNARYNIAQWWNDDGYFLFNSKAKLGTNGVAALALSHVVNNDEFRPYLDKIVQSIWDMQEDNGRLRTWYKPENRDDLHAFYPSEAMAALGKLMAVGIIPKNMTRMNKSFSYYQNWWRNQGRQSTAFIPWQTMADFWLYRMSGDFKYRDFIFEMNDYLITCQDQGLNEPDKQGRYYVPKCRQHGPPHSASTAIYTEGLIYARTLAKEVGDEERMRKYDKAIKLGFRSLMQLWVRGDIDAWHYPNKQAANGGVRTTVMYNEMRMDNVQHTIMALLAELYGI